MDTRRPWRRAVDPHGQKHDHDAPAVSRGLWPDDFGVGGVVRPADVRGYGDHGDDYLRPAGRRPGFFEYCIYDQRFAGNIALGGVVFGGISARGYLSPAGFGSAPARHRPHGAHSRLRVHSDVYAPAPHGFQTIGDT